MFIEELGRELEGAQLAIWDGTSGLPPEQAAKIKERWIREYQIKAKVAAQMAKTGRKGGGCGCGKKN